ncbi:photosystem II reaction center protein Psb28 [Leptolyngbya sp. 7M]|uniref:photosystem II reaction center protein Psb28 n=1 Tax=Leptolyngbya sp. 7M TaxID=2812896 RepID=UPI001B8B6A29|nr:hypothetical protein JVX88_21830 [Leptolyngbya sp. 7M]
MVASTPSIEFFEGIPEDLSDVSLRQNRATGVRSVLMTFTVLRSIERFRSYTNRFAKALLLTDDEGQEVRLHRILYHRYAPRSS